MNRDGDDDDDDEARLHPPDPRLPGDAEPAGSAREPAKPVDDRTGQLVRGLHRQHVSGLPSEIVIDEPGPPSNELELSFGSLDLGSVMDVIGTDNLSSLGNLVG